MDDLDDDLFGSLLKSKSKSSSSEKTTKEAARLRVKDFYEDDPLAGLLPDEEEDNNPAIKTKEEIKSRGFQTKPEGFLLASALPDSPQPATRRRNILDDLLARSDIAKAVEKPVEPAKQDFVLSDQYRSTKTSQDSDRDFGVTGRQKDADDVLFGSYAPSLDYKAETRRRTAPNRALATTRDEKDIFESLPSRGSSSAGAPIRQGRRGISPVVQREREDEIGLSVEPTAKPPKSRNSDWLELKDEPSVSAVKASQSPVSAPIPTILSKKETKATDGEFSFGGTPAEATIATRELNAGSRLEMPEDVPVLTVPEPSLENAKQSKKESFLDWLGAKKEDGESAGVLQKSEEVKHKAKEATNNAEKKLVQTVRDGHSVPVAFKEVTGTDVDFASARVDYETRLANMRSQMAELHTKFSEESLVASATVLDLQTKVRRLEFERDQLNVALEGLESRHKEELAALETSFKKRSQLIEESYQRREQRLQEELEAVSQAQIEKQNAWERERSELIANWQRRVDESTKDRVEDLDRIRDLHRRAITDMKRDHDLAITRLQQIKELEFNAVTEAQSHSKTLQLVIDQLRSNTTELGQLQLKVEGGFHTGLEEREMLLETKDRQLRMLHDQLKKQKEDNEQERVMLRQLIARLEDRLHQQTIGLEEERWKLMQDRNRLEADQNVFAESQKLTNEKLEKERSQLKKAKDLFLEEQKSVLQQIYADKQKLFAMPIQLDTSPQSDSAVLDKDTSDTFHHIKIQAEFEARLRASEEEKARLVAKASQLKLEAEQLLEERLLLTSQQTELEEEKSAINELAVQVKRRSEDIEEMCLTAVQTRDEGFAALHEANRLKVELQKRQETLREQLDALKTKERQLAEQRLTLADQRRQLEHLRSKLLCVQCQSPVERHSHQPAFVAPVRLLDRELLESSRGHLQNGLEAWRVAAQKDKEYLAQESLFLQGLRTNPASSL